MIMRKVQVKIKKLFSIAPDKLGHFYNIFLFSPQKALLMSTHNICFHGEVKKYLIWSYDSEDKFSYFCITIYVSVEKKEKCQLDLVQKGVQKVPYLEL